MELFKPGRQFDFMGQRKFWITLSFSLVVISTILCFYPGPNYGTDFRGGTEVEVALTKHVEPGALREAVTSSGFSTPDVVKVVDNANADHFIIRVQDVSVVDDASKELLRRSLCLTEDPKAPVADEKACPPNARATEVKFSLGGDKIAARYDADPDLNKLKEQIRAVPGGHLRESATNPQVVNPRDHRVEIQLESKGDQLMSALRAKLGADTVPEHALRVEWVGPKAGKQLRDGARNSVAIAIVFIMLYLAFRFDLRFAPGVVIACVHDAMVVIGVFIVLHREITLTTIAAVLTIVGYSMNDTVVVYDRIRENLSKYRGRSFWDIINLSVSETLSRTILTSGATMLSVLAFFIWGTGPIKDLALAMVVGIVAGTYSSIYVAAPLTEWIDERMSKGQKTRKRNPRKMSVPSGAGAKACFSSISGSSASMVHSPALPALKMCPILDTSSGGRRRSRGRQERARDLRGERRALARRHEHRVDEVRDVAHVARRALGRLAVLALRVVAIADEVLDRVERVARVGQGFHHPRRRRDRIVVADEHEAALEPFDRRRARRRVLLEQARQDARRRAEDLGGELLFRLVGELGHLGAPAHQIRPHALEERGAAREPEEEGPRPRPAARERVVRGENRRDRDPRDPLAQVRARHREKGRAGDRVPDEHRR
jgi:preprotein translocase subunit SecF